MSKKYKPVVLAEEDTLTVADFTEAFKKVLEYNAKHLLGSKEEIGVALGNIQQAFTTLQEKITSEIAAHKTDLSSTEQLTLTRLETKLSELEASVTTRLADLKDGETPDVQDIIATILAQLPTPQAIAQNVPIMAEAIRDGLELIDNEDEKLRISAIGHLEERLKKITTDAQPHVIGGHGPLWQLQDVDVSGITTGQSIKWDGIRWIPFTPSGGAGNTVVYNEVVSGSATTFTLAHTPTSSAILRVYANGQRLIPTTDYSLSGAIITTVNSWDAGTVTADYEF